MKAAVFGTVEEAKAFVATVNKALGLPMRGEHIGEGRHVDMPDTWDGTGECPPGWSTYSNVLVSDDGKSAVVPISDADAEKLLVKISEADTIDVKEAEYVAVAVSERAVVDTNDGYTVKADAIAVAAETDAASLKN